MISNLARDSKTISRLAWEKVCVHHRNSPRSLRAAAKTGAPETPPLRATPLPLKACVTEKLDPEGSRESQERDHCARDSRSDGDDRYAVSPRASRLGDHVLVDRKRSSTWRLTYSRLRPTWSPRVTQSIHATASTDVYILCGLWSTKMSSFSAPDTYLTTAAPTVVELTRTTGVTAAIPREASTWADSAATGAM